MRSVVGKRGILFVLAALPLFAQLVTRAPRFQLTPLHGVDFVLGNSPTPRKYLIETMPGGVALLDYNNDGLLDIFLVNAGHVPDPLRSPVHFERDKPAYWNRLYRQNQDGTFTDVTVQAGLQYAGDTNYGMGVAVGDYDNDGFPDIYVTNFGKNILYHNNGDGTFTDVTAKAGVAAGGWSVSAGFFDYDNDGKLDLFVTRYLDWTPETSKTCGRIEEPMYCPPGEFGSTTNILYHNRGDGTFEDVSVASGIAAKKGHGLGVAFADYDGDGFTDVFVTNDALEQFLFHNNGNGTFSEVALDSGAALNNPAKCPREWASLSKTMIMTAFLTFLSRNCPTSRTSCFTMTETNHLVRRNWRLDSACSLKPHPGGELVSKILTTMAGKMRSSCRATFSITCTRTTIPFGIATSLYWL